MTTTKYNTGDIVVFRGEVNPAGILVCITEEGQHELIVRVTGKLNGGCYALQYANGCPVGLPFHDRLLRRASEEEVDIFCECRENGVKVAA